MAPPRGAAVGRRASGLAACRGEPRGPPPPRGRPPRGSWARLWPTRSASFEQPGEKVDEVGAGRIPSPGPTPARQLCPLTMHVAVANVARGPTGRDVFRANRGDAVFGDVAQCGLRLDSVQPRGVRAEDRGLHEPVRGTGRREAVLLAHRLGDI